MQAYQFRLVCRCIHSDVVLLLIGPTQRVDRVAERPPPSVTMQRARFTTFSHHLLLDCSIVVRPQGHHRLLLGAICINPPEADNHLIEIKNSIWILRGKLPDTSAPILAIVFNAEVTNVKGKSASLSSSLQLPVGLRLSDGHSPIQPFQPDFIVVCRALADTVQADGLADQISTEENLGQTRGAIYTNLHV